MPVPESNTRTRIQTLDLLRGVALLGILLMNIPYFGDYYKSVYNLLVNVEYQGPNYWTWWAVNGLFEGTMRASFSMLFGAGVFLFLESLEGKDLGSRTPADLLYRRLIWLLVFGMINAFVFLWPGDILYTYAITGLFLYPFRRLPPAKLLAFSALFLVFSTLQHTLKIHTDAETREKGVEAIALKAQGIKLSSDQEEARQAWTKFRQEHKLETIREEMQGNRKQMSTATYGEAFMEMAGVNQYIQTKDFYYELFFDALSFFLLGMALYRLGYLQGKHPPGRYALVAAIAYGLGLPLSWYFHHTAILQGFDPSRTAEVFPIHPYQIKRLLLAMGHISLVLWVNQTIGWGLIGRWVANVGRMAFTNYLMQTLLCTTIFLGFGLGYYGKLQRFELYLLVLGIWGFQLIFSTIWLRFFQMGPFEWAWRSLTWWEIRPFMRPRNESR